MYIKGTMWTEEQDQELVDLWNAGVDARAIGVTLGRSYGAIQDRTTVLRVRGIDLKRRWIGGRKTNRHKPEPKVCTGPRPGFTQRWLL